MITFTQCSLARNSHDVRIKHVYSEKHIYENKHVVAVLEVAVFGTGLRDCPKLYIGLSIIHSRIRRPNFIEIDVHLSSAVNFRWYWLAYSELMTNLVRYAVPVIEQYCLRYWAWGLSSPLSFMRYMVPCVINKPNCLSIIVRVPVLHLIIIIINKFGIWFICHCIRLSHKTVVYDVSFTRLITD